MSDLLLTELSQSTLKYKVQGASSEHDAWVAHPSDPAFL